jgi:pyrimidine deaminase RibD-like protein
VFSIGDTNDFIAEGGVANLRVENGRVRIEINARAAKEKNLRISSRLMSLVKVVK